VTGPRVLVFAYHNVGYECLAELIARHTNVVAVFTHADDPGETIWFKSVAELAQAQKIPVFTAENVNVPPWPQRIAELRPDILFSFYYRHLIGEPILGLPRLGAFNMHGSLLPRYRGRVPINWAVLHGEHETGATLHHMVRRADAGDIVDQEAVPIGETDTARVVFDKVTLAARRVLARQLDALLDNRAPRIPQDETHASYFGGRRPEDGRIDWTRDARTIFNLIRAVTHPYPGAFADTDGRCLTVWWATPLDSPSGEPGTVLSTAPLRIGCGRGSLEIQRLQWTGEPEQDASAGRHGLRVGQRLGHTL